MKEQRPPADRFSEERTGLRVWVEEHQKRSNVGACIETHIACVVVAGRLCQCGVGAWWSECSAVTANNKWIDCASEGMDLAYP